MAYSHQWSGRQIDNRACHQTRPRGGLADRAVAAALISRWIGEKAARFAEHTYTLPLRLSNVGHPPQETWELVRQASQQKRLSLSELARRSGETTRTGKYAGYNPHTRRSIPRSRSVARMPSVGASSTPSLARIARLSSG